MKWFWILISIILLLGAAALLRSISSGVSGSGAAMPPAPTSQNDPLSAPPLDPPKLADVPTPVPGIAINEPSSMSAATQSPATASPGSAPATKTTPAPSAPAPATTSQPELTPHPAPTSPPAKTVQTTEKPASLQQLESDQLMALLEGVHSGSITLPATPAPAASSAGSTGPTPPASTTGKEPTAPSAAKADAPVKLSPQDDGSVLVDDKYIIRGKGTKDDPYRIPWEMLISAQDSYQPRLGRKIIPERLKMLDSKWVTIAGYVAFPLMAQSADEMLIMLNQWDGCCIGVPPTPYDAVEVKLAKVAQGDERLRVSGSITGILKVDPYLVKDWLVSLYYMDQGSLAATGEKRSAPVAPHK